MATNLLKYGKNIIFFGAPGSGKGTYAMRLSPFLRIPHISSGDLIRDQIRGKTALGKQVESITSRGELISDALLMQVIKHRLEADDAKSGFILDGVPRTVEQISLLDSVRKIDLVLEINLDEGILIKKALARRACERCNKQYNLFSIDSGKYKMPALAPQKAGVCDACGGGLVARDDDTRETIGKRLAIFKANYEPIRRAYEQRGILHVFELTAGVDVMWPRLREMFTAESK